MESENGLVVIDTRRTLTEAKNLKSVKILLDYGFEVSFAAELESITL
jgi:hypothetical protein